MSHTTMREHIKAEVAACEKIAPVEPRFEGKSY